MFEPLRLLLGAGRLGRRLATTQTRGLRARLETLESRCLLSMAPATIEHQWTTWPTPAASIDNVAEYSEGLFTQGRGNGTRENHVDMINNPAVPPTASQPIEIGFPTDWPNDPSNWPDAEPDMPFDPQDPSAPGGYTGIDLPEKSATDVFVGDADDGEVRDVRDMLSSLSYLPAGWQPQSGQALNSQATGPADSEFSIDWRSDGASSAAEAASTVTRQRLQVDPTFLTERELLDEDEQSEGGMVESPADELVTPDDATVSGNDEQSLLDVPVSMDEVYGKFQAFDVSTIEEPGLPAVPPAEAGADITAPRSGEDQDVDPAIAAWPAPVALTDEFEAYFASLPLSAPEAAALLDKEPTTARPFQASAAAIVAFTAHVLHTRSRNPSHRNQSSGQYATSRQPERQA